MKQIKRLKKMMTALFVLVILLQISSTAFASNASNAHSDFDDQLNNLLYCIYSDAQGFGFLEEDLRDIYLGEPIFAYELRDDCLYELDYSFYPITSNGQILFFAIKDSIGVSLSQGLVKELSVFVDNSVDVALVYDKYSCYALTYDRVELLCTFSEPVAYRSTFEDELQILNYSTAANIQFAPISAQQSLSANLTISPPRAQNKLASAGRADVALIVPFVTQNPPSSLCWAASIACIGNYLTGSSYTAAQIAQFHYGNSTTTPPALTTIYSILNNRYGVYYYYTSSSAPNDLTIVENISNGFPLYARWGYSGGNHAGVIRGIYQSVSCVFVMDPEYGFSVAYKSSGNYSYVSAYSAVTLTLNGVVAEWYYW